MAPLFFSSVEPRSLKRASSSCATTDFSGAQRAPKSCCRTTTTMNAHCSSSGRRRRPSVACRRALAGLWVAPAGLLPVRPRCHPAHCSTCVAAAAAAAEATAWTAVDSTYALTPRRRRRQCQKSAAGRSTRAPCASLPPLSPLPLYLCRPIVGCDRGLRLGVRIPGRCALYDNERMSPHSCWHIVLKWSSLWRHTEPASQA